MLPKLSFIIFRYFCTHTAILYVWWNFHNHSFFLHISFASWNSKYDAGPDLYYFCTPTSILHVWWKFHNHSFFLHIFGKLKINLLWHLDNEISVLGKSSHIYKYIFIPLYSDLNYLQDKTRASLCIYMVHGCYNATFYAVNWFKIKTFKRL